MKEIKKEIAKIVCSSGDLQGAAWEEVEKIDKLVEFFKSYARSLVPSMLHYDNDDVKNPEFRDICAFKDGWNNCREEMLIRIDRE